MSETTLVPCPGCRRHVASGDVCPFCGVSTGEPPRGGYGYNSAPPAEATLYGLPPITADRLPAPHYGMPPPRTEAGPITVTRARGGSIIAVIMVAMVVGAVVVTLLLLR